jgi:ferredoxin/flavodoxin---NADP+ reductase
VTEQPSLLPSSGKFIKTRVTGNTEIADNVFLLSLERKFDFIAGQVVGIHFEPRPDARLYSIASGITDEDLKILFNIQPGGLLTPRLAKCKKGDSLYTSTPFGWFTCNNDPAWWIASGTGIAPFVSMFHSGLSDNKTLVHGGRNAESFYFQKDFEGVMKDRYFRCCSGEKREGLYHGRLTGFIENHEDLPVSQTYYLCGRVEMIIEVRDILLKKGIPYRNILSEIYF